jgi:polysaccharide pyruvyl transferase WcaK-like protein
VIAAIITGTPFVHVNTHKRIANLLDNLDLRDLSIRSSLLDEHVIEKFFNNLSTLKFQHNLISIAKQQHESGLIISQNLFSKIKKI